MKTCPQCQTAYTDEYIFCLTDGNALVDDGEQETVVNRKFSMPDVSGESVFCPACGLENRQNSRFCKKCGGLLQNNYQRGDKPAFQFAPPPSGTASSGSGFGETVTFTPPRFDTPASVNPAGGPNRNMIIGAAGVGAVLIVVLLVLFASGEKSASSSSPSAKATNNVANNSAAGNSNNGGTSSGNLPNAFDRDYYGQVGGKELRMHLHKDSHLLTGNATTSRYDELSGSIESDGSFQVNGTPPGKPTTGIWAGQINNDGSIDGTWSKPDGTMQIPFSLTERR